MDNNFIKILISRVESLGLDTQCLRDLISLSHKGEISLVTYSQALNTLDSILSSYRFEANSQPPQISMLLKQLEKRIQNRHEESKVQAKPTEVNVQEALMTSEILSSLMDIKSTLANLNTQQPQNSNQSSHQINDHFNSVEMSTVFVNPIDQNKVDNIKANVSIDSKVGDNIQSKLDKLKNLKKGN